MSDIENKQAYPRSGSEDGNTPVDESQRKTGSNIAPDGAEGGAKPESGEGSDVVAGSPNQGTESR